MDFGSTPSVPQTPPPPPPEPVDPNALQQDAANASLFERRRRGTGSLVVNPTATKQGNMTGLYIGGGR